MSAADIAEIITSATAESLLREVLKQHSSPLYGPAYKGCDRDPCVWCLCAKRVLHDLKHGK